MDSLHDSGPDNAPRETLSTWTLDRLLELPSTELHRVNQRSAGGLTACRLLLGRGMLAVEERGLDFEWGFSSGSHYATVRLGVDPWEAREARRVARRLEDLPKLRRAAETGAIGWGALREIVRKASLETEDFWLEQAGKLPCSCIARLVARTPEGGYPGDDPELAVEPEYSEIRMKLDPEQAVLFQRVVRAVSLKQGRPVSPLYILTRLCAHYLAAEDDITVDQVLKEAAEQVAGQIQATDREVAEARQDVPEAPSVLDSSRASVVRDSFDSEPTWVGERPGSESRVGEDPAPPWAVAAAREEPCPSDERLTLVAGSRVPYWRGTDLEQRLRFNPDARECTPSQRRMLCRRDGYRCSVPGCPNQLWLHVHHVVFHYLGGPTVPRNLCILCTRCHKNTHEGRLVVEGTAPGGLVWSDGRGRPLVQPVDLPPPPGLLSWIAGGSPGLRVRPRYPLAGETPVTPLTVC